MIFGYPIKLNCILLLKEKSANYFDSNSYFFTSNIFPANVEKFNTIF